MNDPLILVAFFFVYVAMGIGLLILAGGSPQLRLARIPKREPTRIRVPMNERGEG